VYFRQVTEKRQKSPRPGWTSYHVHSLWSDGADSIADLVAAAPEYQVEEIGVSDHLVIRPEGAPVASWSLPAERLDDYIADVIRARDAAAVPVKIGLEVDYLPEQMDKLRQLLEGRGFDYLIGSVHFVGDFPVDESESFWARLSAEETNDVCRRYWLLVGQMAEAGLFHLGGHLDLVKKFDFRATADLSREIGGALDAIARAGMAVELNTSGWSKPCREPYPSRQLLRQAASRGIPVVITADAHRKMDLTRDFDRAAEMLDELGITDSLRFASGRAVKIPAP